MTRDHNTVRIVNHLGVALPGKSIFCDLVVVGLQPRFYLIIFRCPGIASHELYKLTSSYLQAVEAAQDWVENNVAPPVEPVGSLATQMTLRALEEQEVSFALVAVLSRLVYRSRTNIRPGSATMASGHSRSKLWELSLIHVSPGQTTT